MCLLQMRVDHRNGTLHFGSQQLESDKVRAHISLLAKRLAKAAAMTDPAPAPAVEQQRAAVLALCRDNITKEHSRLLARKQVRGRWLLVIGDTAAMLVRWR
jgi:translation initiation factor 3 subunit A